EKSKLIIEGKNKDITDSINYAKRIQRAMLPHRKDIWEAFPQSFLLFKPKAVLSGDFYFFHKKDKSVFIAGGDATGHGIPSSLITMIALNKLEDAVSESSDTSEILSLLNIGVKTALKQSEGEDSTRDGMDIALCQVDTENRTVRYAGANRPIWIIRKGAISVEEIKATKKAIGGFTEDSQRFDSHEIKLKEGDTFYLTTDGYADTFGIGGKKMMTKRFKEILLAIQDKSMKEQEKYLEDFWETWRSGTEAVDDVCIIGIRV
ncbi:MAG: serine/threonine-protein phosphatase, partial [Bacteroidetes bacterium]